MDTMDVTDVEIMENTIWSANRLYLRLLETFPKYAENFQAKWNDWQQAISAQEYDPHPRPHWHSYRPSIPSANLRFRQTAHQAGPRSFTALTAIGFKIIPLVVYQLALNENDDTAVHLYTTLETDPSYLPNDPEEVGSSRALQILNLSFDRNRAVRNALADWTERCERVSVYSMSTMYTECAEYYTLLGFGQSIVPHVMLQYAHDVKVDRAVAAQGAHGIGCGVLFWYELLHELVFGRKTGMMTVLFPDVYKWWETWF